MNVLILSLLFPPERGAGKRMEELAEELAGRGHSVSVVTAFPSYPKGVLFEGYRNRLIERSTGEGGTTLCRMGVYISPKRTSFIHRLLHYLSFTVTSVIGGMLCTRPDVVFVSSPPHFLGLSGWVVSRLRRAKLIMEIMDFWPEAAFALGYVRHPWLIRFSIALEKLIYRKTDKLLALSQVMIDKIAGRGVPRSKIEHVFNWCDLAAYAPSAGDALRDEHGFRGKFIVLFAGNIGLGQGLGAVVDAAAKLRDNDRIQFVLLGDGVDKPGLVRRSEDLGLENLTFLDAVPESEVPAYLGMADALFVHLQPASHREAAIPSKLQHYMASAKPLLVAAEGATEQVTRAAGCGVVIPPASPEALAEAAVELSSTSEDELSLMARNGRAFAEANFDMKRQIGLIERHMLELVASSSDR